MSPDAPRAAPLLARALFWFVLVSPGILPLVAPYLPFQDWPAHVGVVGGLLHWGEPDARLGEFYTYAGWLKMNVAFYLPAVVLGQVLAPLHAVNLTLAGALAALGPATAYLCRAVRAPPTLALLAVPLALGRHLYCGFAPNALALAVLMVALGLAFSTLEAPSPKRKLAFAGVMAVLALGHAFIYLAGLGLLGLLVLRHLFGPARRAALGLLAGLVASAGWFGFVFSRGMGLAKPAPAGGPTAFEALWQAIANEPHVGLPEVFWSWLFASHRYWQVDDVLQGIWLGAIGLAVLGSAWLGRRQWLRGPRLALLGLAAVTAAVFWVLPETIGPPINWWGGRLRLPPIVMLLLLPLAGPVFARFRSAAVVAGLVAVSVVGAFTYDLVDFEAEHMAGFEEVVDAIEPGRKLSFLHYTGRRVDEYPGVALGYFGNFALLEHGGAVPQTFFERREYPLVRKVPMPAPSWGLAAYFRYPQHGRGYDGFLVQMHPHTGKPPFDAATLAKLEEVARSGKWAYYRVKAD